MPSTLTLDDVFARARELLQDTDAERYPDTRLLGAANMGLTQMARIRPDMTTLVATSLFLPSDVGHAKPLPIDWTFFGSLVEFVVGWCQAADDEFAVDQRAAALLGRFTAQLTQGG